MNKFGNNAKDLLGQPLDLPCGVRLKNRLVKSAMSDSLGDGAGNPTEVQTRLYERWAEGGAALSLIGEVQTNPHYPEKPGNLVLVPDADLTALQTLAKRGSTNGSHIWPQLGHAGALACGSISDPKGPSSIAVKGLHCDGMSLAVYRFMPVTGFCSASFCRHCSTIGQTLTAARPKDVFASLVRLSTPFGRPSDQLIQLESR